jgi:phosphoglycolate phosphatase
MLKLRTVLFDLDGTLADTAPDMAYALNVLLADEGKPPLPFETIRPQVSHGATALIKLGFGIDMEHPRFQPLRVKFLEVYSRNLCRHTTPFPGILEVLTELQARQLNWGVVTNKPKFLTDPLIKQLNFAYAPVTVVSGDTLEKRKPHPDPLWHAAREAQSAPHECIYVGDAERDVTAGKQAGMKTLVALFGYLNGTDRPESWGADSLIDRPQDIVYWLNANAA